MPQDIQRAHNVLPYKKLLYHTANYNVLCVFFAVTENRRVPYCKALRFFYFITMLSSPSISIITLSALAKSKVL